MLDLRPFGATVMVGGRQLTSCVDRGAEARLLANLIPAGATKAWVYGVGLGDVVKELTARPGLEEIHVAVLCRELWSRLRPLAGVDDPRIAVHMPGEAVDLEGPFVAHSLEVRMADEEAHPLRDRIVAALNAPYNEFFHAALRPMWDAQRAENARLMVTDGRATDLFGTDARPAVVIAGGPTAADSFGWIRDERDRFNVVAVSRALLPLLEAGIVPDAVVQLDRGPKHCAPMYPEVPDPRLTGCKLVIIEDAEPVIAERWTGPRYWFDEATFYPGGSVLHTAADLAVKMGALEVHLVGADLCFAGGASHVAGAGGSACTFEETDLRIKNGRGEWVTTQDALAQYLRGLEEQVAASPHVRWIKHGRAGAPVSGAEWADAG